MSESTKSAVLAKCEGYKPQLRNQLMPIEGTELTIKQYKERGSVCHEISNRSNSVFLQIRPSDPAESDVWGIAADILKINKWQNPHFSEGYVESLQKLPEPPTIDEFEDDLSRRQYHHDLEVARMEGYEQGKAEALEKTLKDAENELFQLIMAEIGSSFHTSIIHTIRKLKEPPRPSDALLWECWKMGVESVSPMAQIVEVMPFRRWLATIPPDTLKADRELVAKAVGNRHSFASKSHKAIHLQVDYEDDNFETWHALKRLTGMEVGNV